MFCKKNGCTSFPIPNGKYCLSHRIKKKICQYQGCTTGASRNAFCIKHGGGKRCEYQGCTTGASRNTDFCITHGGGKRCKYQGCTIGASRNTDFCKKHGGGKRCKYQDCIYSSVGKTDFCVSHGGGKKCQYQDCKNTASFSGDTNFCISHGGGKRCQYQGCISGARGETNFCIKHGGGKRCQYQDCINGSISKSDFCKKHGGGKKCQYQGCTTNSRGKDNFCITHGGGKKCQYQDCKTGAREKDNFCKKHGGGKRCQYHECTTSSQGNSNFCVLHGGGKRCPNCIEWIDSRCGNSKYDDYCATCFKRLFPEDPRSKFIYEHTKEIRVRNEISKTFTGFIHDKCLYICGCDCTNKRRVDHRKLIDGTILALETDEFSHRGYDKKDEEIRYDDLYMIHSGKWIYIRFNPDITRTQKVDLEDRIDILLSEIRKQIKRIEMGENKDLVEIIKLFY
jgi:hypothetical protein